MASKKKKTSTFRAASNNPLVKPYLEAINKISGGDKALGQGLTGGAELGAIDYAPGSMDRLDENVYGDPNVKLLSDRTWADMLEGASPELMESLGAARKGVDVADPNSADNRRAFDLLSSSAEGTPDQAAALALLKQRAESAGQQTDLETELLNLRRAGLGGMGSKELTALREGGGYDAQGNFIPGISEIQNAARSALSGLQANNLISGGPKGRASLIGSLPVVQNVLDQTGNLQRKLILDEYNSKVAAENSLATSLGTVNTGIQDRIGTSGVNYGTAANDAARTRTAAAQNLGNFVQGTNQNFITATGNLGTTANAVENSRANRLQRFIDTVGSIRNEALYRQTFNLNQIDREKAGFSTSMFGGASLSAASAGRKESNALAEKQISAAQSFSGGGNPWRSGSGASSSGGTSATQSDSFDTGM